MKKFISEFSSTFFMVFAGTGAIVINQESGGVITHLGIAITFGLVVIAMIYAFGAYSGAHMNPAVTIALAIGNHFPKKEVALYVVAQLLGAIAASGLLKLLFPSNELLGSTHPSGTNIQSFVLEILLTLFLMFTILSTTKEKNNYAGIIIGFVVLLEALFAGPICGASMNPFRSLAPALLSGNLQSVWIYLAGPLVGAIVGMYVFKFLNSGSK
jgi:aquaporin NIP